jgi:tetratricopeptide (TPR) repeat protein
MKKTLLAACIAIFPLTSIADAALQTCQQALDSGDFTAAAKTAGAQNSFDGVMCAGRAQQASGDYAMAASSFVKAEQLSTSKYNSVLAITFQARAALAAGHIDDALMQYNRSLKMAHEIKLWQGEWSNLVEIGQIYQSKNDLKTALEKYKESYPYASNDNERSESNQRTAAAYHELKDYDHAIEFQLKSVLLEASSGDANQYLNARLQLAIYAMDGKDYKISNKELNDIIKVSKEVGSLYWEGRATLYQSKLEKLQGNTGQSKTLLEAADKLATKSGIKSLQEEVIKETP